MNAFDYYLSVFKNYAGFGGRARRAEFWWFTLLGEIAAIVLAVVDNVISDHGIVGDLYSLATLVPSLAVTFRRLHDTDRSAWWILFGLIPIVGWITMLVFLCQDGTQGPNRYGPSPKGDFGNPYGYGSPYGYGPYPYGPYGYNPDGSGS